MHFVNILIGKDCFQYLKFEDNLVPKAIDYFVKGRYFIVVLDGISPTVYKKPFVGIHVKV